MEKPLNFRLKLSLEEMALRRVVVNLWNETDILSSIAELRFDSLPEYQHSAECQIIVNKVKQKVSKLVVPESLKKRMMDIVRPIGFDLLGWKTFHENIFNSSAGGVGIEILKQLCWNSAGSVDYVATAEKLLLLEILEVCARYKLAALYCLVDYIPALWEQLPDSCQEDYLSDDTYWTKNIEMDFYWAYILGIEKSKLDDQFPRQDSFRLHSFIRSAMNGNRAATEYFFKRLTSEEQNKFLRFMVLSIVIKSRPIGLPSTFPNEKLAEVLCYLLSMMRSEEQVAAFKKAPSGFLPFFLYWPWQDLFLDIADRIWTVLPKSDFERLLWKMRKFIESSGYYIPTLFQKFFLESPSEFKNLFTGHNDMLVNFFSEFFRAEDTETIKVIFRSAGTEERMRMVSSKGFFQLFDPFIMTDRWQMIKVCLDEATPSEEDKDRLKNTYMEFLHKGERPDVCLRRRRWEEIFQELDKSYVD